MSTRLVGQVPGNGRKSAIVKNIPAKNLSIHERFLIASLNSLRLCAREDFILFGEFLKYLLSMSLRSDVAPFLEDCTRIIQEKSGTYHTNIGLSVILLLTDCAELFVEFT